MKITQPRTQYVALVSNASTAGTASGSLTIEDEGTPLATAATTLDFVGAGVTASGAGTTKTITITGGAPTTVDYLVGTAAGGLSAEIVVGTTPGGELGNTWASPTVDATHSGSAHTDFIAKAFLDAKGDLISASADNTPARLAVGTDGLALLADSTQTSGLRWGTPAGSSDAPVHVHVNNLTFSGDGATTDFELPASPVDAYSVMAYVAGVRTDITVSGAILTNMNFAVAPVSGTNNIIVDIAAAVA